MPRRARLAALVRAAADRREGLARLTGQVNSLRSRAEAAEAEIGRLTAASEQAAERAEQAARAFTALETTVAGLEGGELGLDTDHEAAVAALAAVDEPSWPSCARRSRRPRRSGPALAARVEALQVGLNRKDASSALLAATEQLDGVLGSVAALIRSRPATRRRSPRRSGPPPRPSPWSGLDAAVGAFGHLKAEDLGRAGLLAAAAPRSRRARPSDWPACRPACAVRRSSVVECAGASSAGGRTPGAAQAWPWSRICAAAPSLVAALPEVVAVTRDGDVLGAYFAAGGSWAQPSLIEVQAAIDEPSQRLAAAEPRLRAAAVRPEPARRAHREAADAASRWRWPGCTSRTPRWPRWPRSSAS